MNPINTLRLRRDRSLTAVLCGAALLLTGCAGGADDRPGAGGSGGEAEHEVVLVASAAARAGLEAVVPLFEDSEAGEDTEVLTGFGPSSGQSRKIVDGMDADVAAFSLAGDMDRLADEDLVDQDWAADATGSVPFTSVIVLVTRIGEGPEITGWDDLLAGGLEVITPDPRTSGAAMWNLLAPYIAYSAAGADPAAGIAGLEELIADHVRSRPSSARAATEQFLAGAGDVLIATEQEARAAIAGGAELTYTVPADTVLVEFPVAVTRRAQAPTRARALVDFLYAPEAQEALAGAGYRPVDPALAPDPDEAVTVHRIAELGGWETVGRELFDADHGAITGAYTRSVR